MKHSIFILLFTLSISGFAQKYNLSGYINDQKTKENLIGAYIYTKDRTISVSANNYGFFSLKLAKGKQQLLVSCVGYKTQELEVIIHSDSLLYISLSPLAVSISQVDVTAKAKKRFIRDAQTGNFTLNSKEIRNLSPPLFGEADLIKSIQKMPGIQGGKEGSSDLFVRGGNSGENLILLDGVPIYYTAHMLGMLSVFNTDAIKNVEFIKGGFPARYGGRLSSIADIRLKEGNKEKFTGKLDIGIISSKFTLEGPINSKSSFIISGRTTPLSYLALLAEKIGQSSINLYHFYDFTGKFNYQLSKKDKLFISFYTGKDAFSTKFGEKQNSVESYNSSFGLNWGNKIALLRYNRQWNHKIFSNLSLVYSKYLMQSENKISGLDSLKKELVHFARNETYRSLTNDLGAMFNLDVQISNNYFLKYGISLTNKIFQPNAIEFKNIQKSNQDTLLNKLLANNLKHEAFDFDTYIENQIQISKNIHLNAGIHYNQFILTDTSYQSWEPRMSISFVLLPHLSLKSSYARMTQNIHLLGNSGVGFPTDIWVPSTRKIKPEHSEQASLGLYSQWNDKWQASLEAYYKILKNVVDFSQGTNFLRDGPETNLLEESDQNWQDRILTGKGEAYGVEYYLKRETTKWNFSLAYTYSISWRQFAQLNKGQRFPFRYSRKHVFNCNFSYALSSKFTINAAWEYMSGYYVSLPLRKYMAGGFGGSDYYYYRIIQESGLKNNFQVPAYHRLDVGCSYQKIKKRGTAIWTLGVYNVYNRKNPYAIIPVAVSLDEITQVSMFPVLPSISYRYVFK